MFDKIKKSILFKRNGDSPQGRSKCPRCGTIDSKVHLADLSCVKALKVCLEASINKTIIARKELSGIKKVLWCVTKKKGGTFILRNEELGSVPRSCNVTARDLGKFGWEFSGTWTDGGEEPTKTPTEKLEDTVKPKSP